MTEQTVTVNFKTTPDYVRKFNAEVKLRGFYNKDIFNAFLKKFIETPESTLNFLEVQNA